MGFLYYGEPISKNILRNPNDDTIVCRNAIIARTGFQTYKARDVEDELRKIGVSAGPDDDVVVYRSPEEVFSKATIASFEGKSVTDGHPDDLLKANTIREHQCGHVQNVRPGTDALPTRDWPLLADLFITDADLIEKIGSGLRQISCGYNYELRKKAIESCKWILLATTLRLFRLAGLVRWQRSRIQPFQQLRKSEREHTFRTFTKMQHRTGCSQP